jgi:transglutaminase-like putative cysteine protease
MMLNGFVKFPARMLLFVFLYWSPALPVHADNDMTDPSLTIEKEKQMITVNADGSYVERVDNIVLINEERAVATAAQQVYTYDGAIDTFDVISAYTQKRDGRKIIVPPDQIKTQQNLSMGTVMQDTRANIIVFPQVAVGDRLVYSYRIARRTALFAGQFDDYSNASNHPIRHFSVTYDMPEELPLYADGKDFVLTMGNASKGRRRYIWNYVASRKQLAEQGAVNWHEAHDRLYISTFRDAASFAAAYDRGAKGKSVVTPAIRTLADKLVVNLSDPRARVFALADWMRKNIRALPVNIGPGGVVPHDADSVLAKREGDSKDHVALLEALLDAAGIDSTPALVGNVFTLPTAPSFATFTYAITYVPNLNFFLDSNADSIAPGYLPSYVLGYPVVLTKTGALARTPESQAAKRQVDTQYVLHADGSAEFSQTNKISGWRAESTRSMLRNTRQPDRDRKVQDALAGIGLSAVVKVDAGVLDSNDDEHDVNYSGRIDNFVTLPGPSGVRVLSGFSDSIKSLVDQIGAEPERTLDFVCNSETMDEQARFVLPKELTLFAMPRSLTLHDAYIDYSVTYEKADDAVLVKRQFQFHHERLICTSDDYRRMRPVLLRVMRELKSQIIVQAQPVNQTDRDPQ